MSKIKIYLLLGLLCSLSITLSAQKSTVRATIQPSDILIGEQAIINLEVIAPKGRSILFPIYEDTLVTGIEVLRMLPPDTVMTEVMTISQKYVVTSFDSTLYHIPHLLVIDGTDTLKTESLGLKVSAPQLSDSTLAYLELLKTNQTDSIDFQQLQLADIKDIQEPPFVWQDYLSYILYPILGMFLLALTAIVVAVLLSKRKKGYYFTPKVVLPPHVVALQGLEQLKSSKLWQKGFEKEYYTELTTILRDYIKERYHIDAPEMVTDEIVKAVQLIADTKSTGTSLQQILELADLVKFAKYNPLPDENDLSLVNAYLFVNQTKVEETVPQNEPKKANNEPTQQQPKQSSKTSNSQKI